MFRACRSTRRTDVNTLPRPCRAPSCSCAHARYERPAGLLITLYVYIVYIIALRFEGPFTDMIYANKAAAAKAESKKEL